MGLNLGKKMSVPKDIMMEELNLSSNRGSRMFQERQKRAERFTLENAINGVDNTSNVRNWETTQTRSVPFKVVLMPSRCPHNNYLVETSVRYVARKTTTAECDCQRWHSGAALEGPGFNSSPSSLHVLSMPARFLKVSQHPHRV